MRRLSIALPLAFVIATFVITAASALALAQDAETEVEVELSGLTLTGVPFDVTVKGVGDGADYRVLERDRVISEGTLAGDVISGLTVEQAGAHTLSVEVGGARVSAMTRAIPGWLSLLPPLIAILLALLLHEVVLALFAGVYAGALFIFDFSPLRAALRTVDTYVVPALADEDHASIIVFSLLLGGMVGVITRSGGGAGLARVVADTVLGSQTQGPVARVRGQLATWLLGVAIFFDDYANALLVGSSMRPVTDRLKVSREKLAFLVDATAAPVSSVALVSSWIGVEVGYIHEQFKELGIEQDAYVAFLDTLPYRFYPWLMLLFGLMLIMSRRDFGPMLKAERRAVTTGALVAPGSKPASDFGDEAERSAKPNFWNAILPIVTVIGVALFGMYFTGRAATEEAGDVLSMRNIFGNASSLKALLWASAAGSAIAIITSVATRSFNLADALHAWTAGLKSMVLACIILVLAWSLGAVCKELHTAQMVIQGLGSWLSPALLSASVFVIAAVVSFATGTSWGTMAILFPLVVPLAHELAPGEMHIMLGSISSILAGSVWGDHCSPISDTTIMSSMAASCDHVDHVKTQIPYALLVGIVSLVLGELGTGFGFYSPWVGLLLGAVVLGGVIYLFGKPIAAPSVAMAGSAASAAHEEE